jgi:Ferritin-like
MSPLPPVKLVPRNVAAFRRGRPPRQAGDVAVVAGNPMSTRLESGVGNCFPGLECDLRNLERRFFPFLEVDIQDNAIDIFSVDLARVRASAKDGALSASDAKQYARLAADVSAGRSWQVQTLTGTFGPLGRLILTIRSLRTPSIGTGRRPPDAWTAVRMLTEGMDVTLDLAGPRNASMQLKGNRVRYLDDNGALAEIFLPGELTQSLCSPWTHDFRDCGCYYWASNHPDIAQPPLSTTTPSDPAWQMSVPWERSDRTVDKLPPPATANDPRNLELDHYEINRAWQSLNFVVGRREVIDKFAARQPESHPLPAADLEKHVRYAAGVELAVAQEYLAAAYSLRLPDGLPNPLGDDIRAAHAEIMRIAIGEMRHLRAVNDVLRGLAAPGMFKPALQVASAVPGVKPGDKLSVKARAATPDVIEDFINIEKPSVSVDSVYSQILATLVRDGPHALEQSIRTIMAEGEDHFQTFLAVQAWLSRHGDQNDYLRSAKGPPPAGDTDHQKLQTLYAKLLEKLHHGYSLGGTQGAPDINQARMDMLGPIDAAAQAIAARGFIVTFDPLTDPRFAPIDPP